MVLQIIYLLKLDWNCLWRVLIKYVYVQARKPNYCISYY